VLWIRILLASLAPLSPAVAAPVYNQALGTWVDHFVDATGLESRSHVDAVLAEGVLKLTDDVSGGAITVSIIPTSVARWKAVTFSATVPAGASVRIQVLDDGGSPYPNTLLAGNEPNGFSASPIDLSGLPADRLASPGSGKIGRMRLRLLLATSNAAVTPSLDWLAVSWIPRQGDVSPAGLAATAWPITDGTGLATRRSAGSATPSYLALRWVKDQGVDYGGFTTRGPGELLFNKTFGGIVSWPSVTDGKLSALHRQTGATVWERPISGFAFSAIDHTLTTSGALYISDIYSDILLAYDTAGPTLKWTFAFYQGHGNQHVAVGLDGIIYTIRSDDDTFTVFAFEPRGTVKWTRTIDPPGQVVAGRIAIAPDGTLLLGTSTYLADPFTFTNSGRLYALRPADGSVAWSYETGNVDGITPVVGDTGLIYTANSRPGASVKRMYALRPDGTLQWLRESGDVNSFWNKLALRPDRVLAAERVITIYPAAGGALEAVGAENGVLLWTRPLTSQGDQFLSDLFSDSHSGVFVKSQVLNQLTNLAYYDAAGRLKWKVEETGGDLRYGYFLQDEAGRVYGSRFTGSGGRSALFALFPWTLSVAASASRKSIGFAATTSLQHTNPLTGAANRVQVVLDNGTKIPLAFTGTNAAGDTVWTGSLKVTGNTAAGPHTFTAEASAAGVWTDIAVRFPTPAPGSGNTGVTAPGSFSVEK
jgi:hypothetical protein